MRMRLRVPMYSLFFMPFLLGSLDFLFCSTHSLKPVLMCFAKIRERKLSPCVVLMVCMSALTPSNPSARFSPSQFFSPRGPPLCKLAFPNFSPNMPPLRGRSPSSLMNKWHRFPASAPSPAPPLSLLNFLRRDTIPLTSSAGPSNPGISFKRPDDFCLISFPEVAELLSTFVSATAAKATLSLMSSLDRSTSSTGESNYDPCTAFSPDPITWHRFPSKFLAPLIPIWAYWSALSLNPSKLSPENSFPPNYFSRGVKPPALRVLSPDKFPPSCRILPFHPLERHGSFPARFIIIDSGVSIPLLQLNSVKDIPEKLPLPHDLIPASIP